jgi:hypothetical protein
MFSGESRQPVRTLATCRVARPTLQVHAACSWRQGDGGWRADRGEHGCCRGSKWRRRGHVVGLRVLLLRAVAGLGVWHGGRDGHSRPEAADLGAGCDAWNAQVVGLPTGHGPGSGGGSADRGVGAIRRRGGPVARGLRSRRRRHWWAGRAGDAHVNLGGSAAARGRLRK